MNDQAFVPPLAPKFVGSRVPRVEDPRLLAGRGTYVADIQLPGMLHAAFVRSPCAHARISSIDASHAAALAGVHLVWAGSDLSEQCQGIVGQNGVPGTKETIQPLVAVDTVRFAGEAVAVVVADSRHLAEDACDLIEIDYDLLPAVVDPEAALNGAAPANEDIPDNLSMHGHRTLGALMPGGAPAVVIGGQYRTGRLSATPMETRGCVATYDWTSKQLRLWTSTQMPHYVRSMIASHLPFPEHTVEVLTPDVGGGFGQKAHVFVEELVLCLLARDLNRPVKWIEDRRENLLAATHAHEQINDMELSVTPDGKFVSLDHRVIADSGAYHQMPWTHLVEAWDSVNIFPTGIYDIGQYAYDFRAAVTNKCPIGAYRGVGQVAPQIARESVVDLAARELGLSPFEIRRRNAVCRFPYTNCQGVVLEEGSFRDSIDVLERMVDYPSFVFRQEELRSQGRFVGLGVSAFVEVAGWTTAACQALDLPLTMHDTSTVRMEPSGKVTVTTSITSQGQGLQTSLAQVAADALGVRLDDVVVYTADTTRSTWGMGTWGSRGAVIGAGSLLRSAHAIREKLLLTAAHLLEADAADVVLQEGAAWVAGVPSEAIPISQLAATIYFDSRARPPDLDPTLEATSAFDPAKPVYSNGAHAAVVEVDTESGLVTVERFYVVEDCGTMINPMIVEGQIRGGVAQGIGMALLEELVHDEIGQLLTTSFADYLVPSAHEVAPVEFEHLESPSRHTPGGVKGMGESGLIASPAALLNAVNDAIAPFGAVIRDTPVTPERVLRAIGTVDR